MELLLWKVTSTYLHDYQHSMQSVLCNGYRHVNFFIYLFIKTQKTLNSKANIKSINNNTRFVMRIK